MQKQDSPSRVDLTDGDIADLEGIKSSLTQSLESELDLSASVLSNSNNISLVQPSTSLSNTLVASYSFSAPVTPVGKQRSVSVQDRVQSLESSIRASSTPALATSDVASGGELILALQLKFVIEPFGTMSTLKESLSPLVASRGAQKGWVTRALTTLEKT